jgi:hypothetical protein
MFRCTFQTSSLAPSPQAVVVAPLKRRIYRWGGCWWGILKRGEGDVWRAEIRDYVGDAEGVLVESVVVARDVAAPPMTCDDVWDEEFVDSNCGGEYNGLWAFTGTPTEIKQWCTVKGLVYPERLMVAAAAVAPLTPAVIIGQSRQPSQPPPPQNARSYQPRAKHGPLPPSSSQKSKCMIQDV